MQWIVGHFLELVILTIAGVLAALIAGWLGKRSNRRELFTFLEQIFDAATSWLKRPTIIVTLIAILVASILYISWLHYKLFPANRLRIVVCKFSQNFNDPHEVDAWRITKDKILKGLVGIEDEIDIVLFDTMVTSAKESREVGKALKSDLVVWGGFVHVADVLEMEPHITLVRSLGKLERTIHDPTPERFYMTQSISEPDIIDLVRRKAQEVSDIVLLASGSAAYNSGKFYSAIRLLKKVNPVTADVLVLIGKAYEGNLPPNWTEAERVYRQAATLSSDNSVVYFRWGNALRHLSNFEDAEEKYKKAVEMNLRDTYALNNWGACLSELGRYDEAIEKFKRAVEINPKDSLLYYNWGLALYDMGKYEEAIEKFRRSIERNPKSADVYVVWGLSLDDLGRHEEAIEKYRRAVELNPKDAIAYIDWGIALDNLGRYEEAIEKYRRAVELNPKDAIAYFDWGLALDNLGRYEEAIEKFKIAVEINPKDADTYVDWGLALDNLGRYEEATMKYKMAIQIDPKYDNAYYEWGNALNHLGRREEAMEKFKIAIEINPKFAAAHLNLGKLLLLLNRKEEAKQELSKARGFLLILGDKKSTQAVDSLLKGL